MAATTAIGRALFSFIFLASALEKWRALRAHGADAALFQSVTPALRSLKSSINANVGVDLCAHAHHRREVLVARAHRQVPLRHHQRRFAQQRPARRARTTS